MPVVCDGNAQRHNARSEDREFGARAFAVVETLLDRGLIDAHPVKVLNEGLEGVIRVWFVVRLRLVKSLCILSHGL
ncbi:uncharacterized protein NFIA_092530 [Aspergillus fischeri NRRL 181]|uniref:Uncharacterized protein n=1 Tax=Neosartorya fischeri (strain ATCC 1020 / DSM 3700 / CBS 544.65 / FGSC A1164 / JCM 1740 / NRRL 181 / WB 181) TaxID=331117 RepID=A1DIT5_NEOFI|nr:uncharacterized protein NFIA_092530 [Aspergillus fischeri NRRL 181]EAW19292.1 hypothetical protein NFIA_092530 [Aspergillus fischeri NRRL 181]